MSTTTIITMLSIGVLCSLGESLLSVLGKVDAARILGITSHCILSGDAVVFIISLIQKLAQI